MEVSPLSGRHYKIGGIGGFTSPVVTIDKYNRFVSSDLKYVIKMFSYYHLKLIELKVLKVFLR